MLPGSRLLLHRGGVVPVVALAIVVAESWMAVPARDDDDCLVCHGDSGLTTERSGRTISLHVLPGALAGSPHAELACTDCHASLDPEKIPHSRKPRAVDCAACHDTAATHVFHAGIEEPGKELVIACSECHGTHAIVPLDAPDAPLSGARVAETCARCHEEVVKQYRRSEHGKAATTGASGAPTCLACHRLAIAALGGHKDADPAALKITQEKMCLECHLDNPDVRARMGPDAGFIAAYERSVHGAALMGGNANAATCIDCHGSHEMLHGMDPAARVSKAHITETCAACHPDAAASWEKSVHGAAVRKGNTSAPVCTDCHGEHDILRPSDPRSRVAAANLSTEVCSPCHSSVRLSEKYGIASDRFQTFADSFHGLALRGGSLEVANCASCHGAHDILPSTDPASPTHKANLAVTCGTCHPGANERFTVGAVHVLRGGEEEPLLYWVATIYMVVIVVTIGGMLAHNGLDFARRAGRRLRIRRGALSEPEVGRALYLRMTLSERLQHFALVISFTLLVITGFMLSYPDAWWVRGLRSLSSGAFEARGIVHRASGIVMVLAAIVHIWYLAFTARGRRLFLDLLPRRSDVSDTFGMLKYNLHLGDTKPRFGRFGYMEKMEYWALVWGTIVMVATGIILWFENASIGLITKLGWDVARTVHYYEAWLATLAIIVWHLYYVMFNPDVYPMSTAWLTGHLTELEMAEEHGAELDAIRAAEAPAPESERTDD